MFAQGAGEPRRVGCKDAKDEGEVTVSLMFLKERTYSPFNSICSLYESMQSIPTSLIVAICKVLVCLPVSCTVLESPFE